MMQSVRRKICMYSIAGPRNQRGLAWKRKQSVKYIIIQRDAEVLATREIINWDDAMTADAFRIHQSFGVWYSHSVSIKVCTLSHNETVPGAAQNDDVDGCINTTHSTHTRVEKILLRRVKLRNCIEHFSGALCRPQTSVADTIHRCSLSILNAAPLMQPNESVCLLDL